MSEVEFYRDHINGLRQQLILRDSKIEKLEAAVTRGIKLRAEMHRIAEQLERLCCLQFYSPPAFAKLPVSEIVKVLDDMNKALGEQNGSQEP